MTKSTDIFETLMQEEARIFAKSFLKMKEEFGEEWERQFDNHLSRLFGNSMEAMRNALRGYRAFAIDAMRLQNDFNRDKQYKSKSYEQALTDVYLNKSYMHDLYLSGIFLSNFLWPHHFRQLLFYHQHFIPAAKKLGVKEFYDVGTGTGFYSVQLMNRISGVRGFGIDISPYSREFTREHIEKWGFGSEYTSMDVNILEEHLPAKDCIQSVEVLEHLSDPLSYLHQLRSLLKPGGVGFITAALTAPNADHIYLYWHADEVIVQLENAGFEILNSVQECAYAESEGNIAPKIAAFVVK